MTSYYLKCGIGCIEKVEITEKQAKFFENHDTSVVVVKVQPSEQVMQRLETKRNTGGC